MIREIFTLFIDNLPVQYYIRFDKERQCFNFQPSLKYKSAPSFALLLTNGKIQVEPGIEENIVQQAMQKVKDILSDKIFDRF